jgi:inorganic phosphate transporter, PiT family
VVLSSGLVAFGIISLLPVELILQVGSGAGFAMVFALLVAAIIWNLGTWYFGLPNSSSHTLIGSIIGVGIANQLMAVKTGTSGVDWGQAANIGKTLLVSPIVGFVCAGLLLLLMKFADPGQAAVPGSRRGRAAAAVDPRAAGADLHGRELRARLQRRPEGHGADHADPDRHGAHGLRFEPRRDGAAVAGIRDGFQQAADVLSHYVSPNAVIGDARDDVTAYIRTREVQSQHHAGAAHTGQRRRQPDGPVQGTEARAGRSHAELPQRSVRGERGFAADAEVGKAGILRGRLAVLANYKKHIDNATKFIPCG